MRSILSFVGISFVLVIFSSCSHTLKKPEWTFEKGAVRLHIKADNDLNLYNQKPHTLYVCIYQLEELKAFDRLTSDPSGIRKLLECRLFADGVAAADSKVIHAGEDITLTLDRADRAKYLAFVAGYSSGLTDERVVRRHKYQVYKFRKGIFKRVYECKPCDLEIEVAMGAHQIEYSRKITHKKEICTDECE